MATTASAVQDASHDAFEFLHVEIINYMIGLTENSAESNFTRLTRLESLGFRVGQSLIEKATKECPRFREELDLVKFICKEFWMCVFKKQVDNLRTNHQGVYVVYDEQFKFLTNMANGTQYIEEIDKYLAFPCGLIRGALSSLGLNSIVTAEVTTIPSCKFTIKISPA